jgi:Cof subfamily protein (haloacid dehalogenase superfamily)
MRASEDQRLLVALDIDGTLLSERGDISEAVRFQVTRVANLGHEVMLATGRSSRDTIPVLNRLGLTPEWIVCSNGAVTLRKDAMASHGYRAEYVETFNPENVLRTIRPHLPDGRYAVEDDQGDYYYTEPFPGVDVTDATHKVPFEELLHRNATRVVVVSPDHETEDFLAVVERMGLHRVSYSIGWTAWLDISPDGVNKATALERVRQHLNIPRAHVVAAGDGRNDIEMLEWAGSLGRAVAMGEAPEEVVAVSTETCGSVLEDGLADALALIL